MAGVRARKDSGLAIAAAALGLAGVLALGLFLPVKGLAQETTRADAGGSNGAAAHAFGPLFDAVVERTVKSFWDKDLLASSGWERRAAELRKSVLDAPNHAEAARRINGLLGELKSSHTGLLTPEDVEYYILLDVFSAGGRVREFVSQRFWGGGVRYAGAGFFSVRIDGRDFVDDVLEGSPADRAGLKVGDEILSVDAALYHPIRSFRGKVGDKAVISLRRSADSAPQRIEVEVVSIAPLQAFRDATIASARVIERDGRRIGYVHVWASVGDRSRDALKEALESISGEKDHENRDNKRAATTLALDGVIIDMRGKIGGTGQNAARYLDLIDPRGPLMRSRNKDSKERLRTALRGRTAVLIDHHTRSILIAAFLP